MNYDIVGDIHGHVEALEALLSDLGYRNTGVGLASPGSSGVVRR